MTKSSAQLGGLIVDYIKNHPNCSSKQIHEGIGQEWGYATIKRSIRVLLSEKLIIALGKGKGTKYDISLTYEFLVPIDPDKYFQKELDEREIRRDFNLNLISDQLKGIPIFNAREHELLDQFQSTFKKNTDGLALPKLHSTPLLVLISYIQPFEDGNKRTARIISNAILMNDQHCPLSFRTVDAIDYKKAMLIFYEQNNISAFKKIFIEQFEFAVRTYF